MGVKYIDTHSSWLDDYQLRGKGHYSTSIRTILPGEILARYGDLYLVLNDGMVSSRYSNFVSDVKVGDLIHGGIYFPVIANTTLHLRPILLKHPWLIRYNGVIFFNKRSNIVMYRAEIGNTLRDFEYVSRPYPSICIVPMRGAFKNCIELE